LLYALLGVALVLVCLCALKNLLCKRFLKRRGRVVEFLKKFKKNKIGEDKGT
jgi:hypothetical protein